MAFLEFLWVEAHSLLSQYISKASCDSHTDVWSEMMMGQGRLNKRGKDSLSQELQNTNCPYPETSNDLEASLR